jgi:hypothetical protein
MRIQSMAVISVVSVLAAACADSRVYVGDDKLYQVALSASTLPVATGPTSALYIVERRVSLPVRRPSQTQLRDLAQAAHVYQRLPFSRLPWVERDDLPTEIDFVLENLDSVSHEIDVTVNGANEFDEYFPGIVQVALTPVPMHAQWERRYTVPAKSRISGTVREEELDEAAVDLATVVNGAPNPDEVVYFQNQSASDPRSRPYIPPVIPGLIALRLGLRAEQAAPALQAPEVLLEATVGVRDVGGKLASQGDALFSPNPRAFHAIPVAR